MRCGRLLATLLPTALLVALKPFLEFAVLGEQTREDGRTTPLHVARGRWQDKLPASSGAVPTAAASLGDDRLQTIRERHWFGEHHRREQMLLMIYRQLEGLVSGCGALRQRPRALAIIAKVYQQGEWTRCCARTRCQGGRSASSSGRDGQRGAQGVRGVWGDHRVWSIGGGARGRQEPSLAGRKRSTAQLLWGHGVLRSCSSRLGLVRIVLIAQHDTAPSRGLLHGYCSPHLRPRRRTAWRRLERIVVGAQNAVLMDLDLCNDLCRRRHRLT